MRPVDKHKDQPLETLFLGWASGRKNIVTRTIDKRSIEATHFTNKLREHQRVFYDKDKPSI